MSDLSKLVGAALFIRRRDEAREVARERNCPVYLIRTKRGVMKSLVSPAFGEHWVVEPTGQLNHVPGPIVA